MKSIDCQILENVSPEIWNSIKSNNSGIYQIYQRVEWAEVLKLTYGYDPLYLVAYDNSKLVGGFLIFRKKFLKKYSFYSSQGNPNIIEQNNDNVKIALFNLLNNTVKRSLYCEIRPNYNLYIDEALKNGFKFSKFFTFMLDVIDNEIMWKNLDKRIRNSIRKIQNNNIIVKEATSINQWLDFAVLHNKHCSCRGITPKPIIFFKNSYNLLYRNNCAKIFLAYDGPNIQSGMMFLLNEDVMTYYIGSSEDAKINSHDLIMWEAITWASKNNYGQLDLGDTWPNPNSHLYNIHKYKKKWGGRLISSDFLIKGKLYNIGRNIALNNEFVYRIYERMHSKQWLE